jgi:hypothetical protein
VNLDVPHYAANTIAFVAATKKITDTANGLAIFKTGDTILVKGTASNPQVLTVATGNVAGEIVTTEALTDEAAGAYMTILKRAALSNNCVKLIDSPSGKMYARYDTSALKLGDASNGKLNWYDAAKCFTLHPAAADLQMIASSKILRIVGGAAEASKFFVGMLIVCSGFAVACDNLPGNRVDAVTVNGADLDLTLWTGTTPDATLTGTTTNGNKVISGLASTSGLRIGMAITGAGVGAASVIASIDSATQVTGTVNSTASGTVSVSFRKLADEAASGSRTIKIICSSVFCLAAAANVAGLGGYSSGWRNPNDLGLKALCRMEQPNASPDPTAFPGWSTADYFWSATTPPYATTLAMIVHFAYGNVSNAIKTDSYYGALARGS